MQHPHSSSNCKVNVTHIFTKDQNSERNSTIFITLSILSYVCVHGLYLFPCMYKYIIVTVRNAMLLIKVVAGVRIMGHLTKRTKIPVTKWTTYL
jgi:hypothetical protein